MDSKNLKDAIAPPSITSTPTSANPSLTANPGYRAAEAYVRPSPIYTNGKLLSSGFDLRNAAFNFKLEAVAPCSPDLPTEIFLPDFHFPKEKCEVQVSGGKWQIGNFDEDGGLIQKIKWWHGEGEQWIKVGGVKSKLSEGLEQEEGGYYEALGAYGFNCNVM